MADKKKKNGRPSKKDSIDLAQVERLAGLGLTDVEMSHVIGISEQTLNTWKKDKTFLESLKKGKIIADSKVVESLYEKATGGDTTACIFWLKNRQPDRWREKQEISVENQIKTIEVKFV